MNRRSTAEPVTEGEALKDPSAAPRELRRDARANRERVLAAAAAAMLRDGQQVPMATIAEQAGVGVGTLYRRYPTRQALLGALTERSFLLVRALAAEAAARAEPGLASLEHFLDGTIAHREQLVLPLHGGPVELSEEATQTRDEAHAAIMRILDRGRRDGTIRSSLTTSDVVVFGAMLAQPLPNSSSWNDTARRQKSIFLAGVTPPVRAMDKDDDHYESSQHTDSQEG